MRIDAGAIISAISRNFPFRTEFECGSIIGTTDCREVKDEEREASKQNPALGFSFVVDSGDGGGPEQQQSPGSSSGPSLPPVGSGLSSIGSRLSPVGPSLPPVGPGLSSICSGAFASVL